MGKRATGLVLLEFTMPDESLLRLQRTLVENDAMQFLHQGFREALFLADGVELFLVMAYACRILLPDLLAGPIQLIEILTEIGASCRQDFSIQRLDAGLHIPVLLFRRLVFAVAEEPSSLVQMIQGTSQRVPVRNAADQIQRTGQADIPVMVWILSGSVIRALPFQEVLLQGILLLGLPLGKNLVRQFRTPPLTDQDPKQVDFSQSTTEIMPSKAPGIRPCLDSRFLVALHSRYAFLENMDSLIQQLHAFPITFYDSPTDGIRAQV